MWRAKKQVTPAVPTLGQPKPPPVIPFKKENEKTLPRQEKTEPNPIPIVSSEPSFIYPGNYCDDELVEWIKRHPQATSQLYDLLFVNKK